MTNSIRDATHIDVEWMSMNAFLLELVEGIPENQHRPPTFDDLSVLKTKQKKNRALFNFQTA